MEAGYATGPLPQRYGARSGYMLLMFAADRLRPGNPIGGGAERVVAFLALAQGPIAVHTAPPAGPAPTPQTISQLEVALAGAWCGSRGRGWRMEVIQADDGSVALAFITPSSRRYRLPLFAFVLERTSKGLTLSSAATFKRIGTFYSMSCALEALTKAEGVSFVNDNAAAYRTRSSHATTFVGCPIVIVGSILTICFN